MSQVPVMTFFGEGGWMKGIVTGLSIGLLISALNCVDLWAQATAQISGTVRDQSGAVLPGVEIRALQTETGVSRNTISNETGSYVLTNLSLGSYRLEAGLPGFRTFVQTRILELPLNGRNVADLITLGGGAVQTDTPLAKNYAGSNFISAAGGLGFGVEYTLDGARHINFVSGTSMQLPFPDALQEFNIETSGVTAQHGVGAAVGAVTKSGANEFHGDLFEFVRNDLFNARNYFATTQSSLKRNQFGGTVGGSIIRNKLFFFAGYQYTTNRQDPADTRSFIPTSAMLAGDWTTFASPACNTGRQITLRAPFVNNRIDPSLYSTPALNTVNRLLPKAPQPNDCGQVTYGTRNVSNEGQIVARVDYQWTTNHSVFGRVVRNDLDQPPPFRFTPDNLLNVGATGFNNQASAIAAGDTYLIGANIVQSLRVSANRIDVWWIGNPYFSACDVGVKMYCGYAPTIMTVNITGGFSLNSQSPNDTRFHPHTYSVSDDVSVVHGTHQMSFGGSSTYGTLKQKNDFVSAGTMTFNGQDTGLGMGDFMLGRLNAFIQGTRSDKLNLTQNLFAMYATDTWKARPRLTVNYGVRWEPFLGQSMIDGNVGNFSEDRFRQGIKSVAFRNAPAGWYYPGDPGFPGKKGTYNRWFQLAPRMGLAWDVTGDGRTSIRTAYSYSYNFVNAQWREDTAHAAPFGNRVSLQNVPLEDPWRNFPGGNPFPLTVGPDAQFPAYANMQSMPFNVRTPTTSSWNLSVQRQIATAWIASASYVGTATRHLWSQKQLNPATYIPGGPCTLSGVTYNPCSSTANTNQRRRFILARPQDGSLMGFVSDTDDGGSQNYHGMLLSLERRSAGGSAVQANYTWSHCIGDYADVNSVGPAADETYTDPNNRGADRGDCLGELRQVLNLTGVLETPQFGNPTLRTLATGWRLSGIYRFSSGPPLTVITGTDRSLTATGLGSANNQRANQVLVDPYNDRSGRPLTNWLNPAAFVLPAIGTLGNVGRNSIRGPSTWSFDLALSRSIEIREAQHLEFRAEAFNVTNSFRPGGISTQGASGSGAFLSLASNTFGQVRNALAPRILQFALKYVF